MNPVNVFYYSENSITIDAIAILSKDLNLIDSVDLRNRLNDINSYAIKFLSGLPLTSIFISVTSSESLFYRFRMFDYEFDFMMEIFLDFDGENNWGATLHTHNSYSEMKSFSGNLDDIFKTIRKVAFNEEPILENSSYQDFGLFLENYAA